MRPLHLSAAAVALLIGLAMPSRASAQAATCKDGTTASQSGRGACSHHGGVVSIAMTVSCRDGSTATPGRGACSHHGGVGSAKAAKSRSSTRSSTTAHASTKGTSTRESSTGRTSEPRESDAPTGDTVDCGDGTTSSAGRGACSHHGGVAAASQTSTAREPTRPTAPRASSEPSGDAVDCRDGTTSTAGQGACSHHGGVATASASSTARAPASEPDVAAPRPQASGESGDATALCNDGTYSHAEHREGACSYHQGVKSWLRDVPAR